MSDNKELIVRKATADDYDGILDITRNEYLWHGLDYLPFALKNWIEESETEGSLRDNIVFTLQDQIVGFESFYLENDGRTVARFGFRVATQLRGKGYGRRMLELQFQYIKEIFTNATHTISAIPDIDLPDEAFNSAKFGERLKKACKITLDIDLQEYQFPGSPVEDLIALAKDDFRQILKNGDVRRLTGVNLLHMNWVPILLESEHDVHFAVRKDALGVAGKVDGSVSSLSILTWPIPAPCELRGTIDLISCDNQTCKSHIKTQFRNLFTMENRSRHAKKLTIELVFDPQQLASVEEVLAELGLAKFKFLLNKLGRDRDHMYIYKQAL